MSDLTLYLFPDNRLAAVGFTIAFVYSISIQQMLTRKIPCNNLNQKDAASDVSTQGLKNPEETDMDRFDKNFKECDPLQGAHFVQGIQMTYYLYVPYLEFYASS